MSRGITAEDLYRWNWVSDPQISPDGKQIAYVVKTVDQDAGEYRHAIWLVPTDGQIGDARRFTFGPKNDHTPRWSPDGKWLAFVSDREGPAGKEAREDKARGRGKPQIWLVPTDGGEARQVTFLKLGAGQPAWSPDGRHILFSAKTGGSDDDEDEGKKKMPKARQLSHLRYRFDGVGWTYEHRAHLFLIDADGGEPRQLTDGDWNDGAAAWSPDGHSIAFTSDRSEDRWDRFGSDLWVLPLAGGEPYCLTDDNKIEAGVPSWSPDGRQIAFLGALLRKAGGHVDVYTVDAKPLEAGQAPAYRLLTQDFIGSCMDWVGDDMRDEHSRPAPKWSPDGKTLYFLATVHGGSYVYAIPSAGGAAGSVLSGQGHVLDYTLDPSGQVLALAQAEYNHPGDIFSQRVDASEKRRLTEVNPWLDECYIATPERLEFKGADGWNVEGWILKPEGFNPSKKYPVILEIHGGPNTAYGYTFHQEFQMLCGKGYVVLYTNPRGSVGYGREFSVAVRGIWGRQDYEDVMAGVNALVAQGYIDEQQMGVTGGSYGGFMTNWIVGHTDRFHAAVTQRSVTNLATMFGTSDIGWLLGEDNFDVTPWDDPARYAFHSPITYVKNITTPLLILHSEADLRCPIEQGEQLFAALKYMKRDVEFVRFEGQSHGLSRGGHPKMRVERLNLIAGWFDKYMPAH